MGEIEIEIEVGWLVQIRIEKKTELYLSTLPDIASEWLQVVCLP